MEVARRGRKSAIPNLNAPQNSKSITTTLHDHGLISFAFSPHVLVESQTATWEAAEDDVLSIATQFLSEIIGLLRRATRHVPYALLVTRHSAEQQSSDEHKHERRTRLAPERDSRMEARRRKDTAQARTRIGKLIAWGRGCRYLYIGVDSL